MRDSATGDPASNEPAAGEMASNEPAAGEMESARVGSPTRARCAAGPTGAVTG
ncbi:MAG TPA: hypothetical protein VFM01_12150 [Nakamurella sp.]|nr:hypothetical protein [Nakamurella sp.]